MSGPDELLADISRWRAGESKPAMSIDAADLLLRRCYTALTANAALAARCGELERDAERYRWIRNNPTWLGYEHDFMPTEIDAQLDAAMAHALASQAEGETK